MSGKRIFFHCFFVALAVFVADRTTKYLVTLNIPIGDSLPNQEAFIKLYHTLNDGVAFSMFAGHRAPLIILQSVLVAAIIGVMVIGYRRIRGANRPLIMMTSFALMLGGGLGNLVDRIATGKVTDFVSVGSFAIFNVADAFLTSGCALLILYVLLYAGAGSGSESRVGSGSDVSAVTGAGMGSDVSAGVDTGRGSNVSAGVDMDTGSDASACVDTGSGSDPDEDLGKKQRDG